MGSSRLYDTAVNLAGSVPTWAGLGRLVSNEVPVTDGQWRGIKKRFPEFAEGIMDIPMVYSTGNKVSDAIGDGQEAFEAYMKVNARAKRYDNQGASQLLDVGEKPVAWALISDTHIGASGTDYKRLLDDADLIASCPGAKAMHFGDVWDNMIPGKLIQSRLFGAYSTIKEEVAAGEFYLKKLASQWDVVVAGNHDLWTRALAGRDIVADALAKLNINCLYDTDEVYVTIRCGETRFRLMGRHQWRGSKGINPTSPIESAYQRVKDKQFTVGVGGHTHDGCLVREYKMGHGKTGYAVQLGTYKFIDEYSRARGFAAPQDEPCAVLIAYPDKAPRVVSGLEFGLEVYNNERAKYR